jgi:hypothetical protein
MYQASFRLVRSCGAGVAAAVLAVFASHADIASAGPAATGVSPAKVEAQYAVTLNGFELGTFRFKSDVTRTRYTLDTDVELSAMLGLFHWKGVTHSTGTLAANSPKPGDFRFDYESSAKSGSIAMGFDANGLSRLSVLPVAMEEPDEIPVTRAQLKGVLDPLSAILTLTHSDTPAPCARKVAIFDGKQRFDLELRFAREAPIEDAAGEKATVCRVRYTPISGYRPTEETRQLAASNAIEIAFRRVNAAKLMLPQYISVPTPAGEARINLQHVSIELPERGRVASAD